MKNLVSVVCAVFLACVFVPGCGNGDGGSDCADGDGDGYGAGADCLGPDCNDEDAAVHPGASEVPYDGVDNDCDSQTPDDDVDGDGYLSAVDCADDDPAVHPGADEICSDGIDNDCDGETDAGDASCKACSDDADCDDGEPCTSDFCISGFCQNQESPDGAGCDDGLFCTVDDTCTSGNCAGTENTCDDGDACTRDTCNEDYDRCENDLSPDPGAEGVGQPGSCENGLDDDCDGLTDADDPNCSTCSDDADCDDGNECTLDACQDAACSNTPLADGVACDDGQYCTVGDSCVGGVCHQGAPRDCDDGEHCTVDACNEQTDTCESNWVPRPGEEGLDVAGTCSNGTDDDCDTLVDNDDPDCIECGSDPDCDDGNVCTSDSCQDGACSNVPAGDGTACDDGDPCTEDDACRAGLCAGAPKDCSAHDDACNVGACDAFTGACIAEPKADGAVCDDGLFCTVDDACLDGACTGAARDCSAASDQCNDGVCDEDAAACVAIPANEGAPCDDMDPCTEPDVCEDGVCVGTYAGCDPSLELSASSEHLLADGASAADLAVAVYLDPGTPAAEGIQVSFSTDLGTFQESGSALLDSVTDSDGRAYATLVGGTSPGVASVTASAVVEQTAVDTQIDIEVVGLGNIVFVSANPDKLGVAGSGRDETSIVTFQLFDTYDQPLPAGALVEFEHSAAPGVSLDPVTSTTDEQGMVSTTLQAGTVATTVTVSATGIVGSTEQTAVSPSISIVGVWPSARYVTFSCEHLNVGGMVLDYVETECTVALADRYSNKIGFATDVFFRTEAGTITTEATTAESGGDMGTATVTTRTQNPRPVEVAPVAGEPFIGNRNPRDGLVTLIAATTGEEEFTDTDGNGEYDDGEPFVDLGEPFVDLDDDGAHDTGEQFIDVNSNGSYDGPNGTWDFDTLIWTTAHMIWTGEAEFMPQDDCDVDNRYSGICPASFSIANEDVMQFTWQVKDVNLNPLNETLQVGVYVDGDGSLQSSSPPLPWYAPDTLGGWSDPGMYWTNCGGGFCGTFMIEGACTQFLPTEGVITLELTYRQTPGGGTPINESFSIDGVFTP